MCIATGYSVFKYSCVNSEAEALRSKLDKANDEISSLSVKLTNAQEQADNFAYQALNYKTELNKYKESKYETENRVTWAESTTTRSTLNNTVAYADDSISSYNSSNDNSSYSGSYTRVYVTDTGEKYHEYGCKYLKDSCNSISLKDAQNQGYTPCSVCKP